MSKFFLIYGHPVPKSLCGSLKETAEAKLKSMGYQVKTSDLYSMDFNPILGVKDINQGEKMDKGNVVENQKEAAEKHHVPEIIQKEIDKLLWCDNLIIIAPFWWGSMPAIVKGWFERVMLPGVAYDTDKFLNKGLLKGKKAMIATTMSGTQEDFNSQGIQGMNLKDLLHHYHYITFGFAGISALPPFACYAADNVSEEKRKEYL